MKISRRVIQPDGSPKKEDKYVSIAVRPGWKSGTKVTFQKEGDQSRGKIPSDIVFIIRDKPHTLFKREGSDLRYTARLTLKQVNIFIIFSHFIYFTQNFLNGLKINLPYSSIELKKNNKKLQVLMSFYFLFFDVN